MRVLVCGSRTFDNQDVVNAVLTGLYAEDTVGHLASHFATFVLIEGGASGADAAAKWWAEQSPMHSYNEGDDDPRFEHLSFPADWDNCGPECKPMHHRTRPDGSAYCPLAGFRRNQQMLDEGKPDLVVAFVDKPIGRSRGTHDMVQRARNAGLPVYVVERF